MNLNIFPFLFLVATAFPTGPPQLQPRKGPFGYVDTWPNCKEGKGNVSGSFYLSCTFFTLSGLLATWNIQYQLTTFFTIHAQWTNVKRCAGSLRAMGTQRWVWWIGAKDSVYLFQLALRLHTLVLASGLIESWNFVSVKCHRLGSWRLREEHYSWGKVSISSILWLNYWLRITEASQLFSSTR